MNMNQETVVLGEGVPDRPLCELCELFGCCPPRKAEDGHLCLECAEHIDSRSDDWECLYLDNLAYEQQGKRPEPGFSSPEIEVPF